MVLQIIIGLIALGVLYVLAMALRKPDEFRVKREGIIDAKAADIFPYLYNLQKGQLWSPWVAMDPAADYVFEGSIEGENAVLTWDGKKSGKGKLTIIETKPDALVRMRLEFFKPMKAVNICDYTLLPEGGKTRFTWEMYGPNNFMGKVMSVFMNCEKICGDQFEKGIANLKAIVEGAGEKNAA
jgi:Polyketide cyclase / dehydrase and lipid transport